MLYEWGSQLMSRRRTKHAGRARERDRLEAMAADCPDQTDPPPPAVRAVLVVILDCRSAFPTYHRLTDGSGKQMNVTVCGQTGHVSEGGRLRASHAHQFASACTPCFKEDNDGSR